MSKYSPAILETNQMDRKPCARIDLESVKTVQDVELGEEIEIVVKGKVKSMRGPSHEMWTDYKGKEKKETYPGSIELEMSSWKVMKSTEFDGMDD